MKTLFCALPHARLLALLPNMDKHSSLLQTFINYALKKVYTIWPRGDLSNHVLGVHQGVRPYQCLQCPSKFSRKPSLVQHVRAVHEKVKNYKCELCPKSFFRRDHLPRHMNIMHGDVRTLKCEFCPETFTSEARDRCYKTFFASNLQIS